MTFDIESYEDGKKQGKVNGIGLGIAEALLTVKELSRTKHYTLPEQFKMDFLDAMMNYLSEQSENET